MGLFPLPLQIHVQSHKYQQVEFISRTFWGQTEEIFL